MEKADRALQAWLADYASIRAEIQGRSDRQWLLVQVYAAAAVALLGFCVSDLESRWGLLFVIPVATLATSLLFHDHHRVIFGLADYGRDIVRHKVRELTKDPEVLGWEDFQRSKWTCWPLIEFRVGTLLFMGAPVVAAVVALIVHFASSGSGASESSPAAPTASPTPVATQTVSPTPTPVDRLPTPYPPMAVGAAGAPSCPEGWLPYDSPPNDFAFCAPQGWDVIVGSPTATIVDIWNATLSARIAESGSKGGGDIFPGEVFVQMDNMVKTANKERWALSCDQFKLSVSGKEASGCVQYGDPIMGAPEDVVSVVVWIDRGETILVVSGRFWTSETADVDKETILQLARSIQLR